MTAARLFLLPLLLLTLPACGSSSFEVSGDDPTDVGTDDRDGLPSLRLDTAVAESPPAEAEAAAETSSLVDSGVDVDSAPPKDSSPDSGTVLDSTPPPDVDAGADGAGWDGAGCRPDGASGCSLTDPSGCCGGLKCHDTTTPGYHVCAP